MILKLKAGRFGKEVTPRCDRHCKYCLSKEPKPVGDEIFFAMVCPQLQEEWKLLETKIVDLYPNVRHRSVYNKFIW